MVHSERSKDGGPLDTSTDKQFTDWKSGDENGAVGVFGSVLEGQVRLEAGTESLVKDYGNFDWELARIRHESGKDSEETTLQRDVHSVTCSVQSEDGGCLVKDVGACSLSGGSKVEENKRCGRYT